MPWDNNLDFAAAAERVHDALPRALAAGGEVIRALAVTKTPKVTGAGGLAGSAGVTVTGNQAEVTYTSVYARYQEFGVFYRHGRFGAPLTHSNGQSFFLTTSMVEGKDAAVAAMAQVLAGAL